MRRHPGITPYRAGNSFFWCATEQAEASCRCPAHQWQTRRPWANQPLPRWRIHGFRDVGGDGTAPQVAENLLTAPPSVFAGMGARWAHSSFGPSWWGDVAVMARSCFDGVTAKGGVTPKQASPLHIPGRVMATVLGHPLVVGLSAVHVFRLARQISMLFHPSLWPMPQGPKGGRTPIPSGKLLLRIPADIALRRSPWPGDNVVQAAPPILYPAG